MQHWLGKTLLITVALEYGGPKVQREKVVRRREKKRGAEKRKKGCGEEGKKGCGEEKLYFGATVPNVNSFFL